jgi:hypothetical protein
MKIAEIAISLKTVTPAKALNQARFRAKAGIQIEKTGFRVKPGMTIKGKGLLMQYTNVKCQS